MRYSDFTLGLLYWFEPKDFFCRKNIVGSGCGVGQIGRDRIPDFFMKRVQLRYCQLAICVTGKRGLVDANKILISNESLGHWTKGD